MYPTYMYRMTMADQSVLAFCLLLATLFIILFLIVVTRVWWGKPFCYPFRESNANEKDYTGATCFSQLFNCK